MSTIRAREEAVQDSEDSVYETHEKDSETSVNKMHEKTQRPQQQAERVGDGKWEAGLGTFAGFSMNSP